MKSILAFLLVSVVGVMASAITVVEYPFPEPEKGYRRVDIVIPHEQKRAQDLIVIDVAKYSDSCNAFALIASVEERQLQGWGASYLVVKSDGDFLETRNGCDPLTKPRLVPAQLDIYDAPKNYGAQAPYTKVLYVPQDLKVTVEYLKQTKFQEL